MEIDLRVDLTENWDWSGALVELGGDRGDQSGSDKNVSVHFLQHL